MIAKWLSLFLLMGLGALGGCNDQKPASRPDAARGQAEADNTAADVAEPSSEAPVLDKLKAIGIVPGETFDPSRLDPTVAKGLEQSVKVALEKLRAASKEVGGAPVNGWRIPPMILRNFGADYGARAVVALLGLGANVPQDAVYPSAFVDGEGKTLNGTNKYVIHFDKARCRRSGPSGRLRCMAPTISSWPIRSIAMRSAAGCR